MEYLGETDVYQVLTQEVWNTVHGAIPALTKLRDTLKSLAQDVGHQDVKSSLGAYLASLKDYQGTYTAWAREAVDEESLRILESMSLDDAEKMPAVVEMASQQSSAPTQDAGDKGRSVPDSPPQSKDSKESAGEEAGTKSARRTAGREKKDEKADKSQKTAKRKGRGSAPRSKGKGKRAKVNKGPSEAVEAEERSESSEPAKSSSKSSRKSKKSPNRAGSSEKSSRYSSRSRKPTEIYDFDEVRASENATATAEEGKRP